MLNRDDDNDDDDDDESDDDDEVLEAIVKVKVMKMVMVLEC